MDQIQIEDITPFLVADHPVQLTISADVLPVKTLVELAKLGASFYVGGGEEMRKAILYSTKDRAALFSPTNGQRKDPHETVVDMIPDPPPKRKFDTERCRLLWESGAGV